MREIFYNSVILKISQFVDNETLKDIAKQLAIEIDKYEITQRVTELVPYDYIPNCVKTYIVTRKIEGVKKSSLSLYTLRLKQFFEMTRIPIEDITVNDVRLWLYNLQEQSIDKNGKHMSDRTLDGARTIVCSFFKWANAEGYISKNPCVNIKPIKYNRRERQSLTEEELEMLRNGCKNFRDKAIVETLYSTGCRVSELINIKISDIDFDKCEITLLGKGEKYRQSYINTKAKIAICNYLKSRSDSNPYLFISLRNTQKRNLTKAGVEKIIRDLGASFWDNQKSVSSFD